MALYRFRVSFEDYDDVVREIDIRSGQTFEDLHRAIHQAIGYNCEFPSSFYVSNDQWIKGEEITYLPNQRRIDRGVALMDKIKLSSRIDDPHQKFYYTSNFDRPFDFHIELLKIILEENPNTVYPAVVKSAGEPPKQFGNVFNPTTLPPTSEEFDFLNEMEYSEEDAAEGFSEVNDEEGGEDNDDIMNGGDEEEEDEFGSEFSDNEGFEDEGHSQGHDDY
ncbi:MAG: hypothetical protein JST19_11325 [Bacteroidetes bacterium]|nr:hypothetical protein [Bacteroidota bacterium]